MSQPYVGEVRLVGFTFAPVGWALCNGQLLPISQNETLFNLIGTLYGGDGQNTFALPNLQSRVPVHQGSGTDGAYVIGQTGGTESVTVTLNQYPAHSHAVQESTVNASATSNPAQSTVAGSVDIYTNTAPGTPMAASMVSTAPGGSQPHENIQPYTAMNWIISLYGIYPSPS